MQTAEDAPNMQPNDVGPTSEVDGSHSNEPTSSAKSEGTHESSSYGLVSAGDASAVKRYKALVYVALAIAVVIVGTLTYNLTASDETATFEREFLSYSNEVAANAETHVVHIFSQLHALSTAVTSSAIARRDSWPNVTIRHFDVRAREAEALTGVELIVFSPIVTDSNRAGWEEYAWTHQNWIEEDLSYHPEEHFRPGDITKRIYRYSEDMDHTADEQRMRELTDYSEDFYVPVWQLGPVPRNASIVNLDLKTHPSFEHLVEDTLLVRHGLLSGVANLGFLRHQYGSKLDDLPRSCALIPIMDDFDEASSEVVGFITGELSWTNFFQDVLPSEVNGIVLEVVGTCGESFTFQVNGHRADFLGYGHEHPDQFNSLRHTVAFAKAETEVNDTAACQYALTFFPTSEFETVYVTNKPAIYTCVVVLTFVFTALTFVLYEYAIARRQRKLLKKAKRSTAIVASMFPKDVQKRILEEAEAEDEMEGKKHWRGRGAAKQQLKTFLLENETAGSQPSIPVSKPIADLFTETTVAFMDIAGFTAWSSVRDASQVFVLLESVFHKFDNVAQQRRVFKVETVGDCYVAVSGLPEPRKDHALVMARFARDCLYGFNALVKQLESTLGPETGELGLRVGLHTGPVTAGVLRGERARFQLFGDTMNTCARIESLGVRNKIHMSQETAERITSHGKGHWCRPREDAVIAKGKGELKTYWLEVKGDSALSSRSGASCSTDSDQSGQGVAPQLLGTSVYEAESGQVRSASSTSQQSRVKGLVSWNLAVLTKVLREVVARREAAGIEATAPHQTKELERRQLTRNETVLEEFKEVVSLPKFDAEAAKRQRDESTVELGDDVIDQLHEYLNVIATMYRDNAFHNCEHASHVAMSVVKLLSRIVAPDTLESTSAENSAKDLHDHTYGITSDPLTQFAVILAALIHDVDHTGVPNAQLIKEQAIVATVYKNKSVAEQNSVDIAWDLLMEDRFEDLRRVIYATSEEFSRFRQLIVNAVMATDIMDKELGALRKNRWEKAFSEAVRQEEVKESENVDRKATIVIEHLIQASDVAHTMQHWEIYRKWNSRFFEETYKAFVDGRGEKDPAIGWYEGELGFFDFYVIPLAKKLKDCGVFGVSSDEYLNYSMSNRKEWESKGRQLVEEMVERVKTQFENKVKD